MPCPVLSRARRCNAQRCPVDCAMSSWGEWSECSALCGGGTRTRSRSMKVPPQGGGEPCSDQNSIGQMCAPKPCDADCVLGPWGGWSGCSRACGGGLHHRSRSVQTPATGNGYCTPEDGRHEYLQCNKRSCPKPIAQSPLRCTSRIDLAIVMDGGGYLRARGFEKTRRFVTTLIEALDLGPDKVRVGIISAGGPRSWSAFRRCEGGAASGFGDCNIQVVLPMTTDRYEALTAVDNMRWPGAPPYESGALALANNMLSQQGRHTALSVALVISRGKPQSMSRTKEEANKLREQARVIWVLAGRGLKPKEAAELASNPRRDNVLLAVPPRRRKAHRMTEVKQVSEVVSVMCPVVAPPKKP